MWPWRRKDAASPVTPPVRRGDWRTLPPIQRIVPDHPLVNPVQRFSDSLASWRNPSYLAPLAHQVGPSEPAGVIADYARPAPVDLPVAQPPRRRPSTVGTVWSRVRDAVVQRSAAPDAVTSEVRPESPAFDEPAEPDPVVPDHLVNEEVHEDIAVPEPVVHEPSENVVADEPVVEPEPVPFEGAVAALEHPTLGTSAMEDSASPAEPVRPVAPQGLVAPVVPHRVEVARATPSAPQVQRTASPIVVQRVQVAKPTPPSAPVVPNSPMPPLLKVDRVTESPPSAPEPPVRTHFAEVVAEEPPTAAAVVAEPESPQPESSPAEPDVITSAAPLIGEQAHDGLPLTLEHAHDGSSLTLEHAHVGQSPTLVPTLAPVSSPVSSIPPVQRAVHPAVDAVDQASTPVAVDFRPALPGVSATARPVLENEPVPLARKDESATPAVQRVLDSTPPLVRWEVEFSAPSPVLQVAPRVVVEPSQAAESRPVASPPAPPVVQRQVSSVAGLGSTEIVVARRRGLGAPILPQPDPVRPLPELQRASVAEPHTVVQRAPEGAPKPETALKTKTALKTETVPPPETVSLAYLEPMADDRPAVQRLQEAPAPRPVERIDLVGERPLVVNRVESEPVDVVRPWASAAPAGIRSRTPSETSGRTRRETRDAPVAVPPIVSRLIEGAPLAVATSPAVEAPVQRVEQVVRTAAAVQREEVQDVPTTAASSPATAPAGEPEDLVKKLYDPLLRRLKAELWLDRERRGALTDVWH